MKIFGKSFVLAVLLVACTAAIPSVASAEPVVIKVGSGSEFASAVARANAADGGDYVVKLTDDIETDGVSFGPDCSVTILGAGHTITFGQGASLSVNDGAHLSLGSEDGSDTLFLSGGNKACNDLPGLLYIQGDCDMYPGVTIADREGNSYFGGGVTVQGGTFRMHGGTIKNCGINGGSVCYGGGVAVIYGGSFVMDAGTITGCYVKSSWKADWDDRVVTAMGGGVFVSGGSSFVMNGGTIADNAAGDMGGGVAVVSSIDEVSEGLGTLKSSVDILGGTISGNEAHDGAGVFASAYFYAFASGLCAPTPSAGTQDAPGLRIDGAKIVGNKANEQDGRGGGLFAVMLKSPAGVEISGTEISDNAASVGAGVMSYGYYTDMSIKGSVITGNEAARYGGGLAADSNTREFAGTVVSDTKLCNNTAGIAASDVYLNNAIASLPSGGSMAERYLGKPDDTTGQMIDGWYLDGESARYAAQTKDERCEYRDYADIDSGSKVFLIAATSRSLSEFRAKYEFRSATPGVVLPDEVLELLPKDTSVYAAGAVLSAIAPARRVVEVPGGTWTFKGYDRESAVADATAADSEGSVIFVGSWEFAKKGGASSDSGSSSEDGAGGSAARDAPLSGLPRTGDAIGAASCLVFIASAIALLFARRLLRR